MPQRKLNDEYGAAQGGAVDAQELPLAAWYRTIEEAESLGIEWLGPAQAGPQFDLYYLKEKKEIFDQALTALPRRYRDSLLLYYVERLAAKEIAAKLGVAVSRVPHLRYQALLRLRAAVMERLRAPRDGPARAPKD